MPWPQRKDVEKGDIVLIFIYGVGGGLARNDPTEGAVFCEVAGGVEAGERVRGHGLLVGLGMRGGLAVLCGRGGGRSRGRNGAG